MNVLALVAAASLKTHIASVGYVDDCMTMLYFGVRASVQEKVCGQTGLSDKPRADFKEHCEGMFVKEQINTAIQQALKDARDDLKKEGEHVFCSKR